MGRRGGASKQPVKSRGRSALRPKARKAPTAHLAAADLAEQLVRLRQERDEALARQAAKRKTQADGGDYEPTLMAATRNLGESVEIRIRDNGTGIPPEVKEQMFNPFFTTKPAGEGTGLGLSISHDIIVKQHGGSIEVDTQPGEFTEFRVILQRAALRGRM
jgi:signal transduction histidine kinase